ncbi:hypothetical protein BLX05_17805 [Bacillus pseudomycoides]|nr:hypothetical protein BLX05_17805 [Bacillus pseudomycoides]
MDWTFHRYCATTFTDIKRSYTFANLTNAFQLNDSKGVSPPRYQLTTLNYIYYRTNVGASCEPVNLHTPVTYHRFSY